MQFEILGGRYQLYDPIRRGSISTIHRGHDLQMDRDVAIKVMRSTDPKFVTRFQRDGKVLSKLQHPNIVHVYDYGQTNGAYYIVMELVEGTDLRRYMRSCGPLDADRAVTIAHGVSLGLGEMHRNNIIHRNLKPQEVLIGRGGDSIKLTLVRIDTDPPPQYMAPEQFSGGIVTPATDVYALGVVMYEMLTGHPPFDGATDGEVAVQHIKSPPVPPSQINPDIPIHLEEIILRCLEKSPDMRYRDGSQLAQALETLDFSRPVN